MLGGEFVVDEAAQGQALAQNFAHGRRQQVRPGLAAACIVLRDQPAYRHAREAVEQRQHRLPHGAADVLEIDIDALRAGSRQVLGEIGRAMIDRGVETQLLAHMPALVGAAGDADGAGAGHFGELPDQRADRAARGRDDHGLARFRLADRVQARIGREAGHAEHAEPGRDRRQLGVELAQSGAVRGRVGAPAGRCQHDIADRIAGMLGRGHLADALRRHDLADAH